VINGKALIFIGLARDFVSAGLGLAILFGLNLTSDQIAGILLVVTTAGALGAHTYNMLKAAS
jgi:hypothetical protein